MINSKQSIIKFSLKLAFSPIFSLSLAIFVIVNVKWHGIYLLNLYSIYRSLPELPFRGLSNVTYLSVGDNELDEIPKHVLAHMPKLLTVDIGRCKIQAVQQDDFKGIQLVTNLILPSNNITRLDPGAFPLSMLILHLGRNQLDSLNGSLVELKLLQSLFINANNISNLDNELPDGSKLRLLMAHNNRLERLPANMAGMHDLETIHLHFNRLRGFDRVFRNAQYLNELLANNNELEYLAEDEFQSCRQMETINLAVNHIRALNNSLHPMSRLKIGNFSFNDMEQFSLGELQGLRLLKVLDLSYNRIRRLIASPKHIMELPLIELILDHNQLIMLDGALAGLGNLRILSLAENRIEHLLPGEFDGMNKLELLDLTSNQLMELKELETTMLPNLKILKVAYNNISKLEHDFYGLPALCQVNLTNNHISAISSELVTNTRCKNHNVAGKLEIHLDDNPIMCDVRLNELCRLMAAQDARIRGRSQCFENDQEVCTVLPMLYGQIDFPLLVTKLKIGDVEDAKPLVQMLVPAPILIKNNDELLPPIIATLADPHNPLIIAAVPPRQLAAALTTTTTPKPAPVPLETTTSSSSTTTTTTAAPTTTTEHATLMSTTLAPTTTTTTTTIAPNDTQPVILNIEEPQSADPLLVNDTLKLEQQAKQSQPEQLLPPPAPPVVEDAPIAPTAVEPDHVVAKTEYETVDYIPNVVPTSKTNLLEEDAQDSQSNSVHEEYPTELLAQSLQIPEQPPEE
ncbi:ltl [Drosophila busckii]|uniref:Ltl n=1 Tax=Drosophila busckii TaxID=30019 RepID=A0A0M4ECU6_DROBS|nr:ltl [Drosophila busckii]